MISDLCSAPSKLGGQQDFIKVKFPTIVYLKLGNNAYIFYMDPFFIKTFSIIYFNHT